MSTLELENIKHPDNSGNNIELNSNGSISNINVSETVKIGTNESTIGDQKLFISGTKTSFVTLGYSLWQNQLAVHDNRVPSGGAGTEAGVGGSISFTANAGGGQKTWLGLVEGYKQNSTAGDYGGGLKMRVRQHNNPTMLTGIHINSNGHVRKPNQPGFRAYSTIGNISSGAIVQYNIQDWGNGSHYSTGANRFTAPVSGKYAIHFSVKGINIGAVYARIKKNGTHYGPALEFDNDIGSAHTCMSFIGSMNVNDYIEVWAGSNVKVDSADSFSVILIG